MRDWFTILFLIFGVGLCLIAALGVLRLPDLFTRMHASSKSATLGVGCIILGVAIHFGEIGVITRAVLVIAFLFLTAPIAAHMTGRAAYIVGVKLWDKSVVDELRGHYNLETHALEADQNPATDIPRLDNPFDDDTPPPIA